MATGTATTGPGPAQQGGVTQRLLDGIERVGNKVPHPVIMFLYLIGGVIVLSAILALLGVSVTEEIAVPVTAPIEREYYEDTTLPGADAQEEGYYTDYEVETRTIAIRNLISVEGIRFIFTSFVANFAGFGVVAVTMVAMVGVGAAEGAGMMGALIRKLVQVAPRPLIAFIMIFIGVLSSVASDAGYPILIPLAAAAFLPPSPASPASSP
jgi:aminobenzoyl-glutamate transport protein